MIGRVKPAMNRDSFETQVLLVSFLGQAVQIGTFNGDSDARIVIDSRYICLVM